MRFHLGRLVVVVAALAAPLAGAQEKPRHELLVPAGMSASVGAGTFTYTSMTVRGMTGIPGTWDARVTLGTRTLFAGEVAYVGGAQAIDALGLDRSAVLLSNGVEGAVRLHAFRGNLQPYVLVGASWKYLSIQNASFNTSNVLNFDNLFEIPAAVGISYRYRSVLTDLRFGYRAAFETKIIPNRNLSSWDMGLRVGYEF